MKNHRGFAGKILEVDLSDGSINKYELDTNDVKDYIGGKGYGAKLLWDKTEKDFDPLGENNPIIFATGPLTGTCFPTSGRMCIVSKSPLTNTYCDSHVGGHFGPEMKFAGYDFLVLTGRSPDPVYLSIKDNKVEIKDASDLWGKDVFKTEKEIKDAMNRRPRVASIGPAGENLVKYASISIDLYRHAGRGGLGAVMGSKNLKAVAVEGTGSLQVYDRERFDELSKESSEAIDKDLDLQSRRRWGTGNSVLWSSENSLYPTRNYQSTTFKGAANLSGLKMEREVWVKDRACFGCPIHCAHLAYVKNTPYRGTVVEGIEYEVTSMLGSNCDVKNLNAVTHSNMLCDKLGLDALSTGSTIAWAMECFENGILNTEATDGIDLEFGNHEAMNETDLVTFLPKVSKLLQRDWTWGKNSPCTLREWNCPHGEFEPHRQWG